MTAEGSAGAPLTVAQLDDLEERLRRFDGFAWDAGPVFAVIAALRAAWREQTRRARTAQRLRDLRECVQQQTDVAALWEGSYREAIAERDEARRAEAVARVAHAYVECLAEFTDTAAGNLSDCCAEHLDGLIQAVEAWDAARPPEEGA